MKAGNRLEQYRLARSAGTDDQVRLPIQEFDRYTGQDLLLAKGLVNVLYVNHQFSINWVNIRSVIRISRQMATIERVLACPTSMEFSLGE